MSERIKWGVLGNATIARVCVIPAIGKSRNGEVQALATRSPGKAAGLVAEHGIRQLYGSYEQVLSDSDVDAVYIPLPNHLHHVWTLRALGAGKHVLCEKPLARNAFEALEMGKAAADQGLLLMEAFMYRFHPRSREIRLWVADGRIGTPRLVRSSFCFHMEGAISGNVSTPRLEPNMGGGALLDVGCYGVSLSRWMFGQEPTRLQAQAVRRPSGVDVHLVGLLEFPEQGIAVVEASFITALQQTYTIVGSDGVIELPHDAFIPWEKDATFTVRRRDEETGREYVVPGADEYQLMVEHFADAVLERTTLDFPPHDSVSNMRVLDALAEAARTGETVTI